MASALLTRVNGREPKKPRKADNGDGWAVMMTLWRLSSINGFFFCACPPQSKNTNGLGRAERALMAASVNGSQPLF